MGDAIDKRISASDMPHFLFSKSDFFTKMQSYEVNDNGYLDIAEETLGEGWVIRRREAWYVAKPNAVELPRHGFKIHLSLISAITPEALKCIIPVLAEFGVAFKFLVDAHVQDFFNSQACNKVACGKFLTVYPANEVDFKALLEALYTVTGAYYGPYILSDRAYKESRCLFYRYGAFIGNKDCDVTGASTPVVINESTGETDHRLPYYQLPEGIADPFPCHTEDSGSELLNQRYEVIDALASHSSKGGVYLARDTQSGLTVVIKEARPHINRSLLNTHDAISGLTHEAYILQRLEQTGVTPRVVEVFKEWQHQFLVLEHIPFETLNYSDWENHNVLINAHKEQAYKLCQRYLLLLTNIIKAVEQVHRAGVIVGDIAPQNILVHPDTLEIRLIDLEGAYDQFDGKFYARISSRGFTEYDKNKSRKPTFGEDWQAVSVLCIHLLHPVCPLFAMNPAVKDTYLAALVKSHGLPECIIDIAALLQSAKIDKAKQVIEATLEQLNRPAYQSDLFKGERLSLDESDCTKLLKEMVDGLAFFMENPVGESIFPVDYRALNTHHFSVSYGLFGIIYFLKTRTNIVTEPVLKKAINGLKAQDMENMPPGLYSGLSGIAWVMYECGNHSDAIGLMRQVLQSELRKHACDLFYGAAGWGLACLQFYGKTQLPEFLAGAIEAADIITRQLNEHQGTLYYKNLDGQPYSGLLHGNAGIALFFLRLYQITQNEEDLRRATCCLQFEIDRGERINNELVWRKNYNEKTTYPYFQFGSAGLGCVLIRFYSVTQEQRYLTLAKEIALATQGKFCIYPGAFIGMSGIGTFFLDLYQATGEARYHQEAHSIAYRISLYQCAVGEGVAFPGDKLAGLTTDYATGTAGVGLFLSRLLAQGQGGELFLDPDFSCQETTQKTTKTQLDPI
ncbi:class III lanthionine synthetase LanKC [Pseudoalteromonas sp. OOF1S-7]|uniref:class III lanthionine synthetase LanKC n=1 Tax=Pseudoalteromonas sp. OOF1S-7 TaxID=2917757 RepID=UPI001EF449FA|nr:class III lanthionine synthetase LanKC [Pseudoalteromonas sp. OOF1S-7]MCG7534092.1 class III lanthionine synthetase LanKC [Pseudoalteromonas sp. OOF1S-7]